MIIRLTVNDNNFTHILKNYLKDIYNNTLFDLNDDVREYLHHYRVIGKILNPYITKEWSSEQKELIIDRIKKSFAYYVEDNEYLVSNLKIDILESFEDKWENGDIVYWLQHSDEVIVQ